jgi:hypothetical protein
MIKRSIRIVSSGLFPLAALALALVLPTTVLAKGGGGGGDPGPCDGLTNDADRDHDGFPDLQDCEGLASSRREVAFDYPGCLVDSAAAATGDCTHPDVPDVFYLFLRDTDHPSGSAFDESFGGEGAISDAEIFATAEVAVGSGGVGAQLHPVPLGETLLSSPPRGVTLQQAGIIITENRDLAYQRDGSGDLICPSDPPSNGVTTLGNPNEAGNPVVNSQRILDRIDCIFGNLSAPGNFTEKRLHLINTTMHETFHTLEQAPDPTSHHQPTGSDCVMATAPVVDRGKLIVPLSYCGPTQETVQAGATSQSAPSFPAGATQSGTLCGDNSIYDGDGEAPCLTPPTPPGS